MKDQSSFEAWGPQKDQSMMNFGPVGSKCLQFMFKDFPCDLQFSRRRPRPHYLTSTNFNTDWELFMTKACGRLWVWLSCFLPKPLDFSMRHGVQNVIPAWGPLMIWVFFFLQQQEDCCSVIKMNSLDHQCIFKCSVTRLKDWPFKGFA